MILPNASTKKKVKSKPSHLDESSKAQQQSLLSQQGRAWYKQHPFFDSLQTPTTTLEEK